MSSTLGLQSKGNIASDFSTVWFWATCVCCVYPNRTGKWATWPRISPINWVSRSAKLTSVRRLSPPPQKERIMGRRHHPLERFVAIAKQNRTIWVKGVHSYCKMQCSVSAHGTNTVIFSSVVLQWVGIFGRHGTRYHRMLRFMNVFSFCPKFC